MIALERAADRAALVAVIGDAAGHQQPADIGVAEAERAVVVGEARDLLRGELRHRDRDFERQRPQPDRVLIGGDVEAPWSSGSRNCSRLSEARLQAVSSRNMYSEHGLLGADRPRRRAGVPVVDGGVDTGCRDRPRPRRRSRSSPTARAPSASCATCRRAGGSGSTRRRSRPRAGSRR